MSFGTFALAVLVGGGILYLWGFVSTLLPLHAPFVKRYHGEEEDGMREAIRRFTPKDGLYVIPGRPHPKARDPEKMRAIRRIFNQRCREGPVAVLAARVGGIRTMDPVLLLRGIAIQMAAAALAVGLLRLASPGLASYTDRLLLVSGLGLAAWIIAHLAYWNWLYFPLGYTLSLLVDLLIGWTLLGLWLAWIAG